MVEDIIENQILSLMVKKCILIAELEILKAILVGKLID